MLQIFLALWLAIAPAFADGVSAPIGIPPIGASNAAVAFPPTAAAIYTGPLDLADWNTNVLAFWSVRCGSTNYTGNILDITDAATGSTTGTRLKCSSGGVISAVVSASACATTTNGGTFVTGGLCSALATTCAVSCNILTLYDQSGQTKCNTGSAVECDIVQLTNADRPTYTASCTTNSKPCGVYNGSSTYLPTLNCCTSGTGPATAQPFVIVGFAKRTSVVAGGIIADATGFPSIFGGSSANQGSFYVSTQQNATASDNAWHEIQGVANGASSSLTIDATTSTGITQTGSLSGKGLQMGALGTGFDVYPGDITEGGFWAFAPTSGDLTAMYNNVNGYY
jgi:hypothetical protein